ncbi:NAD(P)H-binding protein [Streptomyces lomondensis]|uniref:Nucleotide-diphosphate-sugar epimerase n=1 Tax=Streptomyces lomondensis TaxID=68229 RepID=A0ABQ2WYB1_9ACTN|nr:NAD(P)H-binding protein [Streptomyces lomondensis]MCF0076852.1 NAD(P)H-binding protein [Streptomyces lomondensis]GGW84664.1 nucleotide-diphosphate-sugar epimerase [Streptomyces lomondensis]
MIAVTGPTGNVGRALVERLVAAGRPVRALTRDPQRARLPAGAEAVRLQHDDPAALFEGATQLFLYVQAGGDRTPGLLAAARAAGVRHVVLLSSSIIDSGADENHPIHVMHATAEQHVRDSGLAWTFLRPGGFATNALQWAPQIRAGDTVRGVFADGRTAPVHEDDIAAVAERALLDDGHEGAAHRLTGPAAITNAGQVAAIGRALGRDLRFTELPPDEAGPELFPHVPPAMLQDLLKTFAATVGQPPEITGTVQEITGRPARPFAAWAADHAADFKN